MGKYISGEQLTREKGLTPHELFTLIVESSLQPYNQFSEKIPPPDVRWYVEKIDSYVAKIKSMKINIRSADRNIRNLEKALEWYCQRNDLESLMKCGAYADGHRRDMGESEDDICILENKIRLMFYNLSKCKERNKNGDIYSWQGFSFEVAPPGMYEIGYDEIRSQIYADLSSVGTMFIREDADRLFRNSDKGFNIAIPPGHKKGGLNYDSPEVLEMVRKAKPEIDRLYSFGIKEGSKKPQENAKEYYAEHEETFKMIKLSDIEDPEVFENTSKYSAERIKGMLYKKIALRVFDVKNASYQKLLTISYKV